MQVKAIQLCISGEVDHPLHILNAKEVPRNIEHHAAPTKARHIADRNDRHRPSLSLLALALNLRREKLANRLNPSEYATWMGSSKRDCLRCDGEYIAFLAQ